MNIVSDKEASNTSHANTSHANPSPDRGGGWRACLQLDYQRLGEHSVLTHSHVGPLRVQRPFYPEGEVNHTYVLHPPGGLVGNDELSIHANIHEQAHALITTPGASKAYRNVRQASQLEQNFDIAGTLEWLPQEIILFDDSRLESHSTFNLGGEGRLLMWELQCFGRPAGDLPFKTGEATFSVSINRQGQPLYHDRLGLAGGHEFMHAPWGLNGHTAFGAMLAFPADEALCAQVRERLNTLAGATAPITAAVTLLNGVLVVRMLDHQAQNIRKRFVEVWHLIRPAILGRSVCMPRIWNT